MILCHNCLHKEMVGALFCSECGAQLIFDEGIPTSTIKQSSTKDFVPTTREPKAQEAVPQPTPVPPKGKVTLNIVNYDEILELTSFDELTLGRVSEGQPVLPDIDLSPYKAYEAGVSRMHAAIKIGETAVSVTDLGSANGTRVNGRKISAHIPHPLRNGDILTLGKLKIQVIFQARENGG